MSSILVLAVVTKSAPAPAIMRAPLRAVGIAYAVIDNRANVLSIDFGCVDERGSAKNKKHQRTSGVMMLRSGMRKEFSRLQVIRNDAATSLNLSNQPLPLVDGIQQLPGGLVQDMALRATLAFQSGNDFAQLVEAVADALAALLLCSGGRISQVSNFLLLVENGSRIFSTVPEEM